MRLKSIQIKNFKSVIDTGKCDFQDNDNIIVFAGQNEAGKSAVIEALDFFRNGPSDDFEKLHRRQEEDPEVECDFILSKEDIENIFIETENEKLKKDLESNNTVSFIRCNNSDGKLGDIFFTDETEERLGKFFEINEEKVVTHEDGVAAEEQEKEGSETQDEDESSPVRSTSEELLDFLVVEMRKFVSYDSFEGLLPGVIAIKDIPSNLAVKDFQKVFDVDFSDIVKKDGRGIQRATLEIQKKASDDLNNYWTQKLEENSKYNFNVKITPKEPTEESTVEFMIDKEDDDPLYLEQKSNGFRWFSSFNLRLRSLGIHETTIKNLVILIDEPGQGLHEKAQLDLKNVLEELSEKGAQILYTTHYPNLIGTQGKEFSRIRLVSNSNEGGTKVETVAQFSSRPDVGANDALSPLITAMGIQSVGFFVDKNFKNVVVEGITDNYYLSAFLKIFDKDKNIKFIPACGVNNVPNLVSVLIGWGLNYKAVFDDDSGSGRKAYNLLKKEFYENNDEIAHQHILKIKGCDGIEDVFSKDDFRKYVMADKGVNESKKNSELAKNKKESLSRVFLDKVEGGDEEIKLDKETTEKIKEIFDWLYLKI